MRLIRARPGSSTSAAAESCSWTARAKVRRRCSSFPARAATPRHGTIVVPPDDPIRSSPYDIIAEAKFVPSPDAVQPTVAKTTQVCAYDRPNTRPDGADRSTDVPQPHSVQQDVDDVVALINASQLPTPMVFVAHSYGGFVLDLLARTHPELVAGIVMVDPTSEFLPDGWQSRAERRVRARRHDAARARRRRHIGR